MAGLALVIIGVLIKFNISEASRILPSEFGLAPILSIVIGAIVFVTAFLGCCGAVKESTCMLTTVSAMSFLKKIIFSFYVELRTDSFNSWFQINTMYLIMTVWWMHLFKLTENVNLVQQSVVLLLYIFSRRRERDFGKV